MSDWIRADKNAPRRPNNQNVATFLINNNHYNFLCTSVSNEQFLYHTIQTTPYSRECAFLSQFCVYEYQMMRVGSISILTTTVWKRSVTNREMFRRIFQLLLGLKPFIIVICNKLCKLKIVSQHFKNLN